MALPENLWVVAKIIFGTLGALVFIGLVIKLQQAKGKLAQSEVRVDELEKSNGGIPRLRDELEKAELDRDAARRERDDWAAHWDGIVNGAPSGVPERGR